MKIAIIGAGVAGLTCATELAKGEAEITLYERDPKIGASACSWFAGGMLAPWCELENADEKLIELGENTATWWQQHTGLVENFGTLVVANGRDYSELKRFAARTRNYEWVDEVKINDLEPEIAGRFQKGLFFKSEGHINPRAALSCLYENLIKSGVQFQFNASVNSEEIDADIIINCTGMAATNKLDELRGIKGEMYIIRCEEFSLTRTVRLLHPRIPLYIVPRSDHTFMVGATMIESSDKKQMSVRSSLELLNAAYALNPILGEAEIVEAGVDVRPAFNNNFPRIEKINNQFFVNGLYRHGYLLAPALACKLREQIFGKLNKPFIKNKEAVQC